MCKWKTIVVLLLLKLVLSSNSLTFCVSDGQSCDKNTDALCNATNIVALSGLNGIGHGGEDVVDIYLCSDRYDVIAEQKLHFKNIRSISLKGKSSISHFHCNNTHYGLHLANISQVKLHNVVFRQCGFIAAEFGSHFRACVYIRDSRNITVSNVTIEDSRGMGMLLGNNSGNISVLNSAFHRNVGGVFIDSSTGEGAAYKFEKCNFTSNKASKACGCFQHSMRRDDMTQGGGMTVYFRENVAGNKIEFVSCNFTLNSASNGGGVYAYAPPRHKLDSASGFKFDSCSWHQNAAMYGSALLFVPHTLAKSVDNGFSTIPVIKNCNFTNNTSPAMSLFNGSYSELKYGRGTVYVTSFNIAFEGDVVFSRNADTAVYMYSSVLVVKSNTNALFERNAGAAIRLEGSSMQVNDNVSMTFDSNVAYHRGGAIYHDVLTDLDESLLTKNCFINYAGLSAKPVPERNIRLIFLNNSVYHDSREDNSESIFLSSLLPCGSICSSADEFLNSIAIFSFDKPLHEVLTTYPSNFSVDRKLPVSIVPGRVTFLDIRATDYLNRSVANPVYIISTEGDITIDPDYTIMKNSKIKLLGVPKSSGNVSITLLQQKDKRILFPVTLDMCPPGYAFSVEDSKCLCSTISDDTLYLGIKRCKSHKAALVHGFWAGYVNEAYENSFRTSHCPLGYCTNEHNGSELLLPKRASPDLLSKKICAENRVGVTCGNCRENTSVYFHTQGTFDCGLEDNCHLGFLWLILSELFPISLLFVAIILFDIQLTTGALNGFLLYMQLLITLNISANNFIVFPKPAKDMMGALYFLAAMFNLEFFKSKSLSFCLFKGGNTLDLLIIDYLVVIYSLFLVLLAVILFNSNCKKVSKVCQKFKRKRSVVHGFSGFLVLCYARTTLLSLLILAPGKLYGKGLEGGEKVVFYQGNMAFFGPEHQKYAIPALFAFIVMTCLPPMFLLAYPSCYKVLALLHLEESKTTKFLCKIFPLHKFKPLFDSFQGEFKDEHRNFAALYFIYRFCALAISSFANTLTQSYFFLELLLLTMLTLHGWFQPYKKTWHNRLDSYIFTLMIVINRMTLSTYQQSLTLYKYGNSIAVLTTVQVTLAYTPIVYITLYTLAKILKRLQKKLRERKEDATVLDLSLSYLDRSRDDHDIELCVVNFVSIVGYYCHIQSGCMATWSLDAWPQFMWPCMHQSGHFWGLPAKNMSH